MKKFIYEALVILQFLIIAEIMFLQLDVRFVWIGVFASCIATAINPKEYDYGV